MTLWIALILIASVIAAAALALVLILMVRWLGAILESRRRIECQCRGGAVTVRETGKQEGQSPSIAKDPRSVGTTETTTPDTL